MVKKKKWSSCYHQLVTMALCISNITKILHAIQNLWPLKSSDSSIISYSLTSKVPDLINMFLEGNDINGQCDSVTKENL